MKWVINIKTGLEMIIDCISDLHGEYPTLEGGDLLIVAGDLTGSDKIVQYQNFNTWLNEQKYTKKVLIGGNHDGYFENKGFDYIQTIYCAFGVDYLCDSGTEFQGLKIWGSPWSKWFKGINPHCMAFTGNEELLESKYAIIPDDIDILITHSPPFGTLDYKVLFDGTEFYLGSTSTLEVLERIKPKLHVFGHIHECGGRELLFKHLGPNTVCVNASIMNEDYDAVNKPVRVIL